MYGSTERKREWNLNISCWRNWDFFLQWFVLEPKLPILQSRQLLLHEVKVLGLGVANKVLFQHPSDNHDHEINDIFRVTHLLPRTMSEPQSPLSASNQKSTELLWAKQFKHNTTAVHWRRKYVQTTQALSSVIAVVGLYTMYYCWSLAPKPTSQFYKSTIFFLNVLLNNNMMRLVLKYLLSSDP